MSIESQIRGGIGWSAGTRFVAQLIAWGVSIFVMRILSPTDYGLIAMATVLIGFLNLFSELGLGWAVVNASAHEVDLLTLRKVYGLVLIVHAAIFAIVFISAPFIADFFGEERLTAIARIAGLQFLFVAPGVIPNAILQRELEFKWRSLIGLAAAVLSALGTLAFALAGSGVWALVGGSLIAALLGTIGINLLQPFLHWPSFDFTGLRKLFAFGGYVALSRVFLYLHLQADMVIGGRLLGKEQIGYYSVGMHLASLPMQRVSAILNDVAFPAFSRIQDDRARVAHHVLQAIRLASLFSFPVFWGIGAVAPEIVGVFLGEKWEPAILPLEILAIVMPIRMIGQLMPPTLQGVGKAGLNAFNQFVLFAAMTVAFLIGAQYGIVGLSIAWLVVFPITFLANVASWFPALGIPMSRMGSAMAGPMLAAVAMFASVAGARAYGAGHGVTALATLVLVGAASYVALTLIVNRNGLREARALILRRMSRSA